MLINDDFYQPKSLASLVFRGEFHGEDTEVRIIGRPPRLTTRIARFNARYPVFIIDRVCLLTGRFTETEPTSNLFRCEIRIPGIPGGDRERWTVKDVSNGMGSGKGTYVPFTMRVKGLPNPEDYIGAWDENPADLAQSEFAPDDGWHYLQGGSERIAQIKSIGVIGADDKLVVVYYNKKTEEITKTEVNDFKLPGKISTKGQLDKWIAHTNVTIFHIKLRSINFVNDHGVLHDNETTWGLSRQNRLYPEPEWMPSRGFHPSSPISITKNKALSIVVDIKLQPSGMKFKLVGEGANKEKYLSFESLETTALKTGNEITFSESERQDKKLPNGVCFLKSKKNRWKVILTQKKDKPSLTTAPEFSRHSIFVTWDKPVGTDLVAATFKRMKFATDLPSAKGYVDKLTDKNAEEDTVVEKLTDKIKKHTEFETLFYDEVPNDIWIMLDKSPDQEAPADCIIAAKIGVAALKLLGVEKSVYGMAWATKDVDCTSQDMLIDDPDYGKIVLRFSTTAPPASVDNPDGGYLNNFEGYFKIKNPDDLKWYHYSIYPELGPVWEPHGDLKILHALDNICVEFGQYWTRTINEGTNTEARYHWHHMPDKVPLPAVPK